jgi:hypothetical protein
MKIRLFLAAFILSIATACATEEKPALLASLTRDVEKPPFIISTPQRQQSNVITAVYSITITNFDRLPQKPEPWIAVITPVEIPKLDAAALWNNHIAVRDYDDRKYYARLEHIGWHRIGPVEPVTAWTYTGMDTVSNGPDAQTDCFTYPIPGVRQTEHFNSLFQYDDQYPISPRSPSPEKQGIFAAFVWKPFGF